MGGVREVRKGVGKRMDAISCSGLFSPCCKRMRMVAAEVNSGERFLGSLAASWRGARGERERGVRSLIG